MGVLCLVRHGQSQWNLENRFTGWVDVDLSQNGRQEAHQAAELLKQKKINWDFLHTSRLRRAQQTLDTLVEGLQLQKLERWEDSALNERFYGDLQGMNKDEARQQFGEEQVQLWRRSFDVRPPGGECLADTAKRTLPYFREYIFKECQDGKNIVVSAHGNSLRSIIMFLEKMSPEEILKLEIGTGVPYLYEISQNGHVSSREVLET